MNEIKSKRISESAINDHETSIEKRRYEEADKRRERRRGEAEERRLSRQNYKG
jgi:hypothetical protein